MTGASLIGVLALQGGFRDHLDRLDAIGARTRPVRSPADLADLDGIVIPGGESTTICRLLDAFELREPLTAALATGLPAFGSCAGMIVLADRVLDGRADQRPLAAIPLSVRRNAFGRQSDSFECELEVQGLGGGPFPAAFIRAPAIESIGHGVQVVAQVDGRPVAARTEHVLVTAFHPELTPDDRIHRLFLEMVAEHDRP
ncbi:5'-phosphate synthase pdxT subunit [Nakamurella sp. UYEF19]|uniref:pyridoxal 5'-phosphate synthase glutaminase subunit PdxT n=1 Tax=Nakamurella sp. UYEF19 TaxID=1756392 RepID=UPI003393C967